MIDWSNPLIILKTTSIAFSSVAICITCFRLYLRRARLWWDDGWAFFSLVLLLVQIAAVFMHVPHPDELSQTSRVAAYYIMAATFYAVIWSARLSILFSVIRIETSPRALKQLRVATFIFGFCACFLIAQLFWVCQPQAGWREKASPQCDLGTQVGVCQVVTDVLSDILLCVAPLRVIKHIRSPTLRRRLKIIFSTSIVTTVVSLVHVTYLLTVGGIDLVISAIAENCVSLIVANIPVVLTLLLRRVDDDDTDAKGGTAGKNKKEEAVRTGTGFGFKVRSTFMTTGGWGGGTTQGVSTAGQFIELPAGTTTLTTVDEHTSDGERSKFSPLTSIALPELDNKIGQGSAEHAFGADARRTEYPPTHVEESPA